MKARRVYRLSMVVISIAAVVNVVVAVRVLFALRNPVSYNFRIVEPPVITNYFPLAVGNNLPGSPVEQLPAVDVSSNVVTHATNSFVEVAVEAYHYMRILGEPSFRLNGFNYRVGDDCVYGRILRIYPERVYLDSGYISNSRRTFDLVSPVVQPLANVEPSVDRQEPTLPVSSGT